MRQFTVYDILILAFVIVVTVVVAGLFFGRNAGKQQTTTANKTASASAQLTPPVNPNNPAVKRASFQYVFQGKITSIQKIPAGTQLFTTMSGKNLPQFIITPDVKIYINNALTTTDAFKPGQTVTLTYNYLPGIKRWQPIRADISPNPAVSVSPMTTPLPAASSSAK